MDAGARGLVVAAAADGRLHRPLPRPPGGDHAARRLVARRARGGATRGRALRRDGELAQPGSPATGRASSCDCRATSAAPRRRTGRRARSGGSRSQASPSCAWRRATRDAAVAAIRRAESAATTPLDRARLLPAFVEIALAGGRARCRRSRLRSSSSRSRLSTRARCWERWSRTREARSPRGGRAARGARRACATAARRGTSSTLRTRSRGRASSWETRARLLGDDEAARLEHEAARSIFERLGAAPDLARFATPAEARHGLSRPRARGPPARRAGKTQSRDRGRARHQRAHGRAARPEHLREARALVPRRGDGVRVRARPRLSRAMVRNDHGRGAAKLVDPCDGARRDPTYRRAKRRGGRRWQIECVRHRDHRRRAGGARDWIPPAAARPVVRDPRRERARRRSLAQALGLAPALLAGVLRRAARAARSRRSARTYPTTDEMARLPRGVRGALRAPGPVRGMAVDGAREGRRRVRRDAPATTRSRPTTSSSLRA